MARYYEITLSGSKSSKIAWTSFPNGTNDPGALNVELDLFASVYGIPANTDGGASTVTIWGIPLTDLRQASQFSNLLISVKGGMKARNADGTACGLPLVNERQAGTLIAGEIFQSFGTWVGTDMSLTFVVSPAYFPLGDPGNFVFHWKPGTSLASAIQNTLEAAYRGKAVSITVRIANTYTTATTVTATAHIIPSFQQFAQFVNGLTKGAVTLAINQNSISVTDAASVHPKPIQLVFTDLIGQPAWVDQGIIQFRTVMRADIQVNALVLMPKSLQELPGDVTTAAQAFPSQLKYSTTFQGPFTIQSARHVGNFRDPSGASWVSIFTAIPSTPPSTFPGGLPANV